MALRLRGGGATVDTLGMGYQVGLDLGGTKIEGVILAPDGAILRRQRVPTRAELGYQHIVETAAGLGQELLADAPGCTTLGVGTPGAVSGRTGRIKNSNTQCLLGQDLRGDIERRVGVKTVIENDANCFALAEARHGAGRGGRVVFGVIMGTGVGGGIAIAGDVHSGLQRIAGEWGHHSIDPVGPECYCGQRGCVETYLSGPALERSFAERSGAAQPTASIVAASRRGEAVAATVVDELLDHFGRALANVVDILDPDVVVLGGGLSNIDELYSRGRDRVEHYVFSDELATPIVRNQLGDSAGVVGAALLGARPDDAAMHGTEPSGGADERG